MPSPRAQERRNQRTGLVIARHGNVSITQIQGGADQLPLTPPFADERRRSRRDRSPLGSLRASERSVKDLIGRGAEIAAAREWMSEPPPDGPDHRILVVHGPGGAGKTRLAAEILQLAEDEGWRAGFLSESARMYPYLSHISHPNTPTMVAVDYAEARFTELKRLFEDRPVDHEGDAPFRVILVVREGVSQADAWLHRLEREGDLGSRAEELLKPEALTVFSLDESLPDLADREKLWLAGVEASGGGIDAAPPYLADTLFERPLLVLLDVHRALAEPDEVEATAPTEDSLFATILKHERRYWAGVAEDRKLDLAERRMYQVAALATLVGGVARSAFETALRSLEWLRDDEDLLLEVSDWWCAIYETGAGAIRGVEPDIVGEYLVMRALGPRGNSKNNLDGSLQVDRLRSLIGLATPAGRQRLLRVLTRIASGGSDGARALLAELLDLHLKDFLPATFTQVAAGPNLDDRAEPLAMTVASAVLACDRLQLVSTKPGASEVEGTEEGDSSAAIHQTAVGIVRRQIERVALRELESERWSVERFADVMTWALRFDLEAGEIARAEREILELEKLEPRPHMALATMRRELGRDHFTAMRYAEAAKVLEAALADVEAAGEQESRLGYMLMGDLGNAVRQLGQVEKASSLHEEALEGLRRTAGPGAESTISVLRSVVYSVALRDLDDALRRGADAIAELEAAGADEETIDSVSTIASEALLAAARAALQSGDAEGAERLFARALAELEAGDKRDSLDAYIVIEGLGLAAAAQGDEEGAAKLLEEALEGKRRLRDGYDHPGTVTTLIGLSSHLARIDLDRAVEVLAAATAELRDAGSPRRQIVVNAQVSFLARAGRTGAAFAVVRSDDEATIAREVRQAALDTIADPTLPPMLPPFAVAVDAVATAGELFDAEDRRIIAFASRLGLLTVERASAAVGIRITPAGLAALAQDDDVAPDVELLTGTLQMPDPGISSATIGQALADVQARIREAVRRLPADPAVAGAGIVGQVTIHDLAGVDEVRRWLMRCGHGSRPIPGLETDAVVIGGILSWSLTAAAGLDPRPPIATEAARAWRELPDRALLEAEGERLRQDLVRLEIATEEDAAGLVQMGVGSGYIHASRLAVGDGELDAAEELCEEAGAALERAGCTTSGLGLTQREQTGVIAAARADLPAAAERIESALDGWRELEAGSTGIRRVAAVLNLAAVLVRVDLDRALAAITAEIEALEGADDRAWAILRLRRGRVEILHAAVVRALTIGDDDRAYELSARAAAELDGNEEIGSMLGHTVLHDFGISLLRKGEREAGIRQLETALEGARLAVGPTDSRTQVFAATLAETLAVEDPGRGLAVVDELLAECDGRANASGSRLRVARAGILRELALRHQREGDIAGATARFSEGMAELTTPEELDSNLGYALLHDLGDMAVIGRDFDRARALFRQAMEGRRRLLGVAFPDTLASVSAYAEAEAYFDLQAALDLLDATAAELESQGADAEVIRELRSSRAFAYRTAGSRANREGSFEEAERHFELAIAAVEEFHGSDTELHYLVLDEMAKGLMRRKDRKPSDCERAAELLREAHQGARRLAGAASPMAISLFERLADATAGFDVDAAAAMLEDGIAEMKREEAGGKAADALRRRLAGVRFLQGGKAADADDLDQAVAYFEASRDQLLAAEDNGSGEIFIVLHELGELAAVRNDPDTALRLLREATEGKRARAGIADLDTLASVVALAEVRARTDVDAALATLDETLAELEATGAGKDLTGYVTGAVARLHLQAGRGAEASGDLDEAERLYGLALEENAKIEGEGELNLTSVLTHDLADVAAKRRDSARAIELYREALEGKRRVLGPADAGTIDTLVGLANVLARTDLPAAMALLEDAVAELEGMDAAPELVRRVRDRFPRVQLLAGRAAHAAGDDGEAERLFRVVLAGCEAEGESETQLAYATQHDLAAVLMDHDDSEQAARLLGVAFEGKRRLHGLADPDTLTTFVALSEALALDDPPAGAELTTQVLEELCGEGADPEAIETARRARARLLLGLGFNVLRAGDVAKARAGFEEAIEQLDEAAADEPELRFGLLHGLAEVAGREDEPERAVELFREAYVGMRRYTKLTDAVLHEFLDALLAALVRIEPEEAVSMLDEVAEELAEQGERLPGRLAAHRPTVLVAAGQKAVAESEFELADRRYREALDELREAEAEGSEAAFLITRNLGELTAKRGESERGVELLELAWRGLLAGKGPEAEVTIGAQMSLAEGLLPVDPNRALELLEGVEAKVDSDRPAFLRAGALLHRGRQAGAREDWDAAEEDFEAGLALLAGMGAGETHLAGVLSHDLGDAAMAKGDFEAAMRLYASAVELKRKTDGLTDEDTLASHLALAQARAANSELAEALDLADDALAALSAVDGPEPLVKLVGYFRAGLFLQPGRVAEAGGDLDEAERLYRTVLTELEATGERHSHLAYVALHDLGDVALTRGDRAAAISLYEESLRGKRRVEGIGEPDTQATLLRLAEVLMGDDPVAAFTVLESAEEELAAEGNDEAVARIREWLKGQDPPEPPAPTAAPAGD
jgi:tetratricopeptide (TPR) repeat protein